MAWYVKGTRLVELITFTDRFKPIYEPGDTVQHAGIYKCLGCNREVVAKPLGRFPNAGDHEHSADQGPFGWKLLVLANLHGL